MAIFTAIVLMFALSPAATESTYPTPFKCSVSFKDTPKATGYWAPSGTQSVSAAAFPQALTGFPLTPTQAFITLNNTVFWPFFWQSSNKEAMTDIVSKLWNTKIFLFLPNILRVVLYQVAVDNCPLACGENFTLKRKYQDRNRSRHR